MVNSMKKHFKQTKSKQMFAKDLNIISYSVKREMTSKENLQTVCFEMNANNLTGKIILRNELVSSISLWHSLCYT